MTNQDEPTKPANLRSGRGTLSDGVKRASKNREESEICSFCGRGPSEVNALVTKTGGGTGTGQSAIKICDLCVTAAREQIREP